MSTVNEAAPKYPFVSNALWELLDRLYRAKDDEDEKRKVEALILPLLTSQSVNSVYGNGVPILGCFARDSYSFLAVALQL